MNSKQQYFVSNGFVTQQVYPINDTELVYTAEKEEDAIFYIKKLKTKLKFANDAKNLITDFDFFYGYESDTTPGCKEFNITIKQLCNGEWIDEFYGAFATNEGDWDLDRCNVQFNIEPRDIYGCIAKNKDELYNFLEIPTVYNQLFYKLYDVEFFVCAGPLVNPLGCPGDLPQPAPLTTWAFVHTIIGYQAFDAAALGPCSSTTINVHVYFREAVISICNNGLPVLPGGGGWVLADNFCNINGTAKYVRYPTVGTPLPFPADNAAFNFGYYNQFEGAVKPPGSSYSNIIVTPTPQSPPIFGFPFAQNSGVPNAGSIWYYRVVNNPNSTYVWSYVPTGTGVFTITVGLNANEVGGFFSGAFTGNIAQVVLTETHGNGYVSTVSFFVTIFNAATAQAFAVSGLTTVGQNVGWSSQVRYFIPKPPISNDAGVTVSPITWYSNPADAQLVSQTFGESVYSFNILGLNPVSITYSYTITSLSLGTITVTGSILVAIKEFNFPAVPIRDVIELYPTEVFQLNTYQYNGAITGTGIFSRWRNGETLLQALGGIPGASYIFSRPTAGNYCISLQQDFIEGYVLVYVEPIFGISVWINLDAYDPDPFLSPWIELVFPNPNLQNQRRLEDIFNFVLDEMDCGVLGVRSDLFQWNPYGDAPGYTPFGDYVTGAAYNRLKHITLGSLSDLINLGASQAATIANISFEMLDTVLRNCFNAFWYIDLNGYMRIEHIKFFNLIVQYNANAGVNAKFNIAKNKYSYDKAKIPRKEKFKFSYSFNIDFVGKDIIFDNLCTNQDQDNNDVNYDVPKIVTDVEGVLAYPGGFNIEDLIMISTEIPSNPALIGAFGFEINNTTIGLITNQVNLNAYLSWANLQWNYHRWNRPLIQGNMNGNNVLFFSAKKLKLQKDIVLIFCCESEEEFQFYLTQTQLGQGIIQDAEINKKTGTIKLNLLQ